MIDRFERFVLSITEIDRYWHRIAAAELESYGLRGPHAVYLTTLLRHPEGLTASQLCAMCARDKADVSRVTSAMEKRGLICRKAAAPQNIYRTRMVLTEEGRQAAEHVCRRARVAVERAGSGLTDAERETFYAALDSIKRNLQAISEGRFPDESGAEPE